MKRLLFLLFPILTYSQNIEAYLTFTNITKGGEVTDPSISTRVGDEIQMEVNLRAPSGTQLTQLAEGDFKYLTLDIAYNNDVFVSTGHTDWPQVNALGDSGPIKEVYNFPNQIFKSTTDLTALQARHIEWTNNGGYSSDDQFNVIRIALQLSDKDIADLFGSLSAVAIYIERFTLQSGAETDAEAEFHINFGTLQKLNGNYISDFDPGSYTTGGSDNATYNISQYIKAATAPLTTIQYILNDNLDPTNFTLNLFSFDSSELIQVESEMLETYTLDVDGKVQISDLKIGESYMAFIQPINTDYVADVHTITDAYRSFKGLNDVGINGNTQIFDEWEKFTADVNLNNVFDSVDVWGLLAYVLGIDPNEGNTNENFCLPEVSENGEIFHGCTAVTKYDKYNVENLLGYFDEGPGWEQHFTVGETSETHTFAFWHHGDIDFSHSTPYPTPNSQTSKSGLTAKATTQLDLVSSVENGKVILDLNHNGLDIVGLQARIKYDTSILELDEVRYDTGNTATNFAKDSEGEILFGSLVKEGDVNIKKGTAFKIIFSTTQQVDNTTGLFYFVNTDAVQSNGDKVKLNIQ